MPSYSDQLHHLLIFAQSIGIGLLIGLEREKHNDAIAGIRTFPLIAIAGTLSGYAFHIASYPYLGVVMALVTGASLLLAQSIQAKRVQTDLNTTSVIAGVITFSAGFLLWFDHNLLITAVAIVTTIILYFKDELHAISNKLSEKDAVSFFQFAAIAFILLPVLPDQTYGPYSVINPYQVGWLVVLISGISLSGYLALQTLGQRTGLFLVGLFGGLVSTTATTMVYARYTRTQPGFVASATTIIMLANLVLFARILVEVIVVERSVLPLLAPVMLCGLVFSLAYIGWLFLRQDRNEQGTPELNIGNPTELKSALGFALMFAAVLLLVAWMNETFQERGVYLAAFLSGLTDVDAITLSSLKLVSTGELPRQIATNAILVAYTANLLFKFVLVTTLGVGKLRLQVGIGFLVSLMGIVVGWNLIPWFTRLL